MTALAFVPSEAPAMVIRVDGVVEVAVSGAVSLSIPELGQEDLIVVDTNIEVRKPT